MIKSIDIRRDRRLFAYTLIMPALILEVFIHFIPMVMGLLVSIKNVNINTLGQWFEAPFIGLGNYARLLQKDSSMGARFLSSALVSLKYGVTAKVLHFGLGLWGALLMHREFRGRAFFRTIFMIPYAIPSFISAISWKFMFQKEWGLINYILVDKFHLLAEKPFWLVGDNAFWAVVIAQVWRGWSFHFIMILAGLQTISPDLYEAVEIDGGNSWHKFFHVTLVGLKPILVTLLVVNGMRIFNEFETTFVMLSERPAPSANVMSVNIYNQAFNNWDFGLSSANAITWILMILALSLVLKRLLTSAETD
jgi:multiple sugar transport system permease protein